MIWWDTIKRKHFDWSSFSPSLPFAGRHLNTNPCSLNRPPLQLTTCLVTWDAAENTTRLKTSLAKAFLEAFQSSSRSNPSPSFFSFFFLKDGWQRWQRLSEIPNRSLHITSASVKSLQVPPRLLTSGSSPSNWRKHDWIQSAGDRLPHPAKINFESEAARKGSGKVPEIKLWNITCSHKQPQIYGVSSATSREKRMRWGTQSVFCEELHWSPNWQKLVCKLP